MMDSLLIRFWNFIFGYWMPFILIVSANCIAICNCDHVLIILNETIILIFQNIFLGLICKFNLVFICVEWNQIMFQESFVADIGVRVFSWDWKLWGRLFGWEVLCWFLSLVVLIGLNILSKKLFTHSLVDFFAIESGW